MGSGIPCALEAWPRIDLVVDDPAGNQFSAVAWRPEAEWQRTGDATDPVTLPVTLPVTPPVTPPVARLLGLLAEEGELSNKNVRERLQLKDRTHVREHYITPALEAGLIELTIPDKPNSRLQKYRLTASGQARLRDQGKEG